MMSNEIGKHGNYVWDYFIKTDETAKCSLCNKILKISQRSTTGLKYHLKSIHCIDLATSLTYVPQAGPSTSKDELLIDSRRDSEGFKQKIARKRSSDSCLTKEHSKEFMISRIVAKDGISFKCLSTSEDLRYLFLKNGLSLPTSSDEIKSIIENFSLMIKNEIIKKLQSLKICGKKFSLTFDRWMSVKNKTYLNINVHNLGTYFNLGLVRILNTYSAEDCLNLVKTRLETFSLNLDTDIVGITTDDISITKKMARLLSCYRQLCFAQGIHLAVVDILYKNAFGKESFPHSSEEALDAYSSGDDNGSCDDEKNEEHSFPFAYFHQLEQPPAELILNYRGLIEKVRTVVKLLRKSPTEKACLQKYVQQDLGTIDYTLILDSKTSWSSLFNMLECLNFLKDCTKRALTELGSDIKFSDEEWTNFEELLFCLHPVKLAVDVLCRRDSTLLTADTTLRFILEKLDKQQSEVSADLATALRKRIKERRTELSGIILYLHNPKKYESIVRRSIDDETFFVPKKHSILLEIKNICERMLILNENTDDESFICKDIKDEEITMEENLSLNEELEMQLIKEESDTCTVNVSMNSRNLKEIIRAEMIEYENRGIKGKYLSLVHNYLNNITPTTFEAERAFSTFNCTYIPIKNKLTDKTIDTICFLRSYFTNNNF